MELTQSLLAVIPVFLLIATGYIFASWKTINLASVTELIVYLGTPSLALSSLASRRIFLEEIMILSFGLLIIFAVVGLLVQIYFLVFRFRSRGFTLPVLFMNAGNMGIPLALFAFGQAGMQRATFLFVLNTVLQYSLGIYILKGRGEAREIFRLPLIYATVTGLALNLTGVAIPEAMFQAISLLGQATIPLMLVSLGYRLRHVKAFRWRDAAGGALTRIVGGFAAALIAVQIVGATGVNRQVLLLYGCLPAAVVNFVLTEKYGQDPELAASIVVFSTVLSLVTTPIALWLIM